MYWSTRPGGRLQKLQNQSHVILSGLFGKRHFSSRTLLLPWGISKQSFHSHQVHIDELSFVCRKKFTHRIDGLTTRISNRPTRKGDHDQVSPPPLLFGPSIPIVERLEGLMLTKHYAHVQTEKNLIERDRCTSFTSILADAEQLPIVAT